MLHLDAPAEGFGHDVIHGTRDALAGFAEDLHGIRINEDVVTTGEFELVGHIDADLFVGQPDEVVVVGDALVSVN